MAMTQQNIREHYESTWKTKSDSAADLDQIAYSSPIEDAIVYPLYRQMIADLKLKATDGSVLDVGSGSGRWIRFFLESFKPRKLVGTDYTQASVELLKKWFASRGAARGVDLSFRHADITDPSLDLGEKFDLINIANVLFHIPEPNLFAQALANLARHISADGTIVTTEYLPRGAMRTEWMFVRDRYSFEHAVHEAGLRIIAIKAFGVFANDPMGIDGPDNSSRGNFIQARGLMNRLASAVGTSGNEQASRYLVEMLTEIERAVLNFCRERIAEIDMPSQKLVFLARA